MINSFLAGVRQETDTKRAKINKKYQRLLLKKFDYWWRLMIGCLRMRNFATMEIIVGF
jgi:hypothetical protein